MMEEKRAQLESIIRALKETEGLLAAGRCDWEAVARVIDAIRMEQKNDWVSKYFTEEQLQTMGELSEKSYSQEAREQIQSRSGAWTEEDQQKATADWTRVYSEARRLAAEGADPAGPEAQAIAKLKHDLLSAFTQGNTEVAAGVGRWWENFRALPEEKKPFDASPFDAGAEGNALLDQAFALYVEGLKS